MVAHSWEQAHNNLAANTLAVSNAIHSVFTSCKIVQIEFLHTMPKPKGCTEITGFLREERRKRNTCFIQCIVKLRYCFTNNGKERGAAAHNT